MPFKDPERRREYHREYQRRYSKGKKRKRKRKKKGYFGTLADFDKVIEEGRCIWRCMTATPCRKQAIDGFYCALHSQCISSE